MPTYYGGAYAFPDTRSLPPTGVPLTTTNEASAGEASYPTGGGGGGSVPPNLSVSTLTVENTLGMDWLPGNTGAQLQFYASTNGVNGELIQMLNAPSGGVADPNGYSIYLDSYTNNSAVGGGTLSLTNLNFAATYGSPAAGVIACGANSQIYLTGVSSINGAAPGGGGSGPNPSVSSLTVAVNGTIEFLNDNTWDAGGVAWDTDATGTSSIIFAPSYANDESGASSNICLGTILTVAAGSSYQNIGANTLFLNTGYGNTPGAVIMNDPLAPGTAYVSSIRVSSINGAAPGGGAAAANPSTFSTLVGLSTINNGAPANLTVFGEMTVTNVIGCSALSTTSIASINPGSDVSIPLLSSSNLNVSSINGSAYPPAGGGAVFSTLYDTSSTIVCNPGGPTQLLGFPCVNGQGYNVSWQVGVTGFAATTINAGENILGLLTVDGGTTSIAGNVTLAAVSTNAALGFDSLQVGGCLNFKGGTNSNVFLEVYNNTNSTVTVTLNESYLVTY